LVVRYPLPPRTASKITIHVELSEIEDEVAEPASLRAENREKDARDLDEAVTQIAGVLGVVD
jgi:hypothetical protein